MRSFPVIKDLVTDVSFNYEMAKKVIKPLTALAAIAGVASLMLLAVIRGDLLAQEIHQDAAPVVVIDDDMLGKPRDRDDALAMLQRLSARSHDVLVRQDWTGASIRDLVSAQLMPFVREDGASIDMSGENFILKPDAVQNLGFALFELGTNAVKYGALAARSGKIAISWELVEHEGRKYVRLVWQEKGGPPVSPPARKGFGLQVIERDLAQELDGSVNLDFQATGLICTLDFPTLQGDHSRD